MEPANIDFTDAASLRVSEMKEGKENLRVYIAGGGCSGFSYGFKLDEREIDGDVGITKNGVQLLIDPMSLQYLTGAEIDYQDNVQGSQFVIPHP